MRALSLAMGGARGCTRQRCDFGPSACCAGGVLVLRRSAAAVAGDGRPARR